MKLSPQFNQTASQLSPSHNSEPNNYDECINKATGEIIGRSQITDAANLPEIIENARMAQKKWEQVEVSERAALIKKLSAHIESHCDKLADTISQDTGKTRVDALATELLPSAMAAAYYAKKAKSFLKDRYILPGHIALANKISKIVRVPFGVIGIISPWNYPFAIPFSEVAMGLLAGNAVILKTAGETQMAGLAVKEAFESIGLPENLFNYVHIPGRIAGDAFLNNGIDKLFFTGSVPVGKYLMGRAAETLTPVSLELGGNDAMIVCEDANPERAAAGAVWAGFQNAGQSCGGVERIYVHEDIYDKFMECLKERTEALRVGYDSGFTVDVGVMTTDRQINTVKTHVEEALSRGAVVFAEADSPKIPGLNNAFPPVVLTEVSHDMLVMKEETFGPVLGVMKVKTIDEAIGLANDSNLGLTGSVWSKDRKKAETIGRKIRAGAITINDHLMSAGIAETPWGGFGESGIGRTHGEIGFEEMTEPQVIVQDIMPFIQKNIWWYPHNKSVYDGIRGILETFYGDSLKTRIAGSGRLLKSYIRVFSKNFK